MARWSVKLDAEHRMWPWLVETVGWTMSRADSGSRREDGLREGARRHARLPGMELEEAVSWKRLREGGPLGKLPCMWEDGVYLGVKGTTGEMIVGGKKDVGRTRTEREKDDRRSGGARRRWNSSETCLGGRTVVREMAKT